MTMKHMNMYAMYGDKTNQILFSYLQNKTYMHKHKYYSPLSKKNMHISQILLPLFVNHQQKGNSTKQIFSPFLSKIKRSRRGKTYKTKEILLPLFCSKPRINKGLNIKILIPIKI